jgi:YVTN family beta-propeller protein
VPKLKAGLDRRQPEAHFMAATSWLPRIEIDNRPLPGDNRVVLFLSFCFLNRPNSATGKTQMNLSTTRLPFILAPLPLLVLCLVSPTGFAQESVSNSLPKNQVVATIPVGSQPNGMVVSPDSKSVYATNFTGNAGIVQVIDTASNTVTFTINLGNGAFPNALTVTPDGSTLYVAEFEGTRLWAIDTATRQVTKKLNVSSLQGLAVSPDGKDLYVCNTTGTVLIIHTATNKITKRIQIGQGKSHRPWDVVFTPDGSRAYIAAKPTATRREKIMAILR